MANSKTAEDNTKPDTKKQVPGYPTLAGKMSLTPRHAILKGFAALGMQNLLYYQAELVHLENRLRKAEGGS
jgi:hypothetical protein